MAWKKNGISYFLWAIYSIAAVSGIYAILSYIFVSKKMPEYLALLFTGCIVLIIGGGFFSARLLFRRRLFQIEIPEEICERISNVFVTLGALVGIGLRVLSNLPGQSMAEYVNNLSELSFGKPLMHGAEYVYSLCLEGVVEYIGDYAFLGGAIQIVFELLAFYFVFLAVKELAGDLPAVVTFLCGTVGLPFIENRTLLSPEPLFFLGFSVCFYLLAVCMANWVSVYAFFGIGLYVGIMAYLDVLGWLVLFVTIPVLWYEEDEWEITFTEKLSRLFMEIFGVAIGFAISIFLDAYFSLASFERLFQAYAYMYLPKEPSLEPFSSLSCYMYPALVLCAVLIFGIFAYWFRKGTDRISFWVFGAIGIIGMITCEFMHKSMTGIPFLVTFLCTLAGVGLLSTYCDRKRLPLEIYEKKTVPEDEQSVKSDLEVSVPVVPEETLEPFVTDEKKPEIDYIENPLPGPKKHVAKSMDYDIEVSDDDDYDI